MMATMFQRRQWRDKREHRPATLDELYMSNAYIGFMCVLAGVGTALIILLLIFGQPFVDALFKVMP